MNRILKNLDEILCGAFLVVIIFLTFINQMARYFSLSILFAEEIVMIAFIWCIFLGTSVCFRYNMHMGVDIISEKFGLMMRKILQLCIDSFLFILNSYVAYLSYQFVFSGNKKTSPIMHLPYKYINASLLVSFGLMAIYGIYFITRDINSLVGKPVMNIISPLDKIQEDFLREQEMSEEASHEC